MIGHAARFLKLSLDVFLVFRNRFCVCRGAWRHYIWLVPCRHHTGKLSPSLHLIMCMMWQRWRPPWHDNLTCLQTKQTVILTRWALVVIIHMMSMIHNKFKMKLIKLNMCEWLMCILVFLSVMIGKASSDYNPSMDSVPFKIDWPGSVFSSSGEAEVENSDLAATESVGIHFHIVTLTVKAVPWILKTSLNFKYNFSEQQVHSTHDKVVLGGLVKKIKSTIFQWGMVFLNSWISILSGNNQGIFAPWNW